MSIISRIKGLVFRGSTTSNTAPVVKAETPAPVDAPVDAPATPATPASKTYEVDPTDPRIINVFDSEGNIVGAFLSPDAMRAILADLDTETPAPAEEAPAVEEVPAPEAKTDTNEEIKALKAEIKALSFKVAKGAESVPMVHGTSTGTGTGKKSLFNAMYGPKKTAK